MPPRPISRSMTHLPTDSGWPVSADAPPFEPGLAPKPGADPKPPPGAEPKPAGSDPKPAPGAEPKPPPGVAPKPPLGAAKPEAGGDANALAGPPSPPPIADMGMVTSPALEECESAIAPLDASPP